MAHGSIDEQTIRSSSQKPKGEQIAAADRDELRCLFSMALILGPAAGLSVRQE